MDLDTRFQSFFKAVRNPKFNLVSGIHDASFLRQICFELGSLDFTASTRSCAVSPLDLPHHIPGNTVILFPKPLSLNNWCRYFSSYPTTCSGQWGYSILAGPRWCCSLNADFPCEINPCTSGLVMKKVMKAFPPGRSTRWISPK